MSGLSGLSGFCKIRCRFLKREAGLVGTWAVPQQRSEVDRVCPSERVERVERVLSDNERVFKKRSGFGGYMSGSPTTVGG